MSGLKLAADATTIIDEKHASRNHEFLSKKTKDMCYQTPEG
jgi:hypothetical protein